MKLEQITKLELTYQERTLLEEIIHMLGEMESNDDIKDFINSWLDDDDINLNILINSLTTILDITED